MAVDIFTKGVRMKEKIEAGHTQLWQGRVGYANSIGLVPRQDACSGGLAKSPTCYTILS